MAERRFKYMRGDFGKLPVDLRRLTIYLNFLDGTVEASNCLEMIAAMDLDELGLDANNLEIKAVEWCSGPEDEGSPLAYDYQLDMNRLTVKLPRPVAAGERFFIRTITRCAPSDHILEGIYKDSTPEGAPQQYMSQFQQWGFQRVMPILDDCRAKCAMTTTIEADAAYTHLISNGNISRRTNPEGKPVPKPGGPAMPVGRQVITYENPAPMAPYLFLVCVGTWDMLVDSVSFKSGRTVRLEYLVPPGATEQVRIPMEILKDSILWTAATQDYEYTADTYRTICMNKSNFGGMENVGNTTIVTDAALITEHTLDFGLLYAHGVIVHEFEHNQCGSETTMETPFDVWLNEAYTVDVERQYMADRFDPDFIRLTQVDSIRNPLVGPLTIEDAGHAGRIVREGFNDPDELIDGVTYVKAAEVIRMLRLILGKEKFREGKTLYFSRYHNGNADTDQFFACFEEVSGISLEQFKRQWLYTIGYPKVTAAAEYEPESGRYLIRFRQGLKPGQAPFHLPLDLALVDAEGRDIKDTRRIFQLRDEEAEIIFENIAGQPAFASMNRDYSFYGAFLHENATVETRTLQARLDPNVYNRVDAMKQLTDIERIKLVNDPAAGVSEQWLELYGEILSDRNLSPALKSYFLRIEEQPMDRDYITWYPELVDARERLMLAVNGRYRSVLHELFEGLDTYSVSRLSPRDGIEDRMMKAALLDLVVADDSPDSHELIIRHFRSAATANDRVTALLALNRCSSPVRHELLEEVYHAWKGHLSGYANYLRVVAAGTRPDVFDMIEVEKARPAFDITQPTWCRALFLPMATNNKMLWTDTGINWMADTVIALARINITTTGRLLNTFQHVAGLKPVLREKVRAALEKIVSNVSESETPAIYRQAKTYLGNGGPI